MFSVWSELVSEGADTAIGAKRVVTAEGALMSELHALVHVLASSFEVTQIIAPTERSSVGALNLGVKVSPHFSRVVYRGIFWRMDPVLVSRTIF